MPYPTLVLEETDMTITERILIDLQFCVKPLHIRYYCNLTMILAARLKPIWAPQRAIIYTANCTSCNIFLLKDLYPSVSKIWNSTPGALYWTILCFCQISLVTTMQVYFQPAPMLPFVDACRACHWNGGRKPLKAVFELFYGGSYDLQSFKSGEDIKTRSRRGSQIDLIPNAPSNV